MTRSLAIDLSRHDYMQYFPGLPFHNVDSNRLPATTDPLNATTTVRRKIIPSVDLLRDCYSTESSNTDVDPLSRGSGNAGGNWTSTDNESTAASCKTPDSLATQDLFDDSVFDGELDWIGWSMSAIYVCYLQTPASFVFNGGPVRL